MRVLLLGLTAAGCGSVVDHPSRDAATGDAPPDTPQLGVVRTPDRIELTSPGRFRLVLERDFGWQPSGWYDLARGLDQNLVEDSLDRTHRVLGAINVKSDDGWVTADRAAWTMLEVEEAADHVEVRGEWRWVTPHHSYVVRPRHVFRADGSWTTRATISDVAAAPGTLAVEYANTHVAPELTWSVGGDGDSFRFASAGAASTTSVQMTRQTPLGELATHESPRARYFSIATPTLPVEVAWETQLGSAP